MESRKTNNFLEFNYDFSQNQAAEIDRIADIELVDLNGKVADVAFRYESQNFSTTQLFDIQKRVQSEGDSMQFYLDIFSADEFLEFKSINIILESGDIVIIKKDNGDPFTFILNQKDPTVETKETINEEL